MPGAFLTDISKRLRPAMHEAMRKLSPLGRAGEPGEIVGAALYLASDAFALRHRLDPQAGRRRRTGTAGAWRGAGLAPARRRGRLVRRLGGVVYDSCAGASNACSIPLTGGAGWPWARPGRRCCSRRPARRAAGPASRSPRLHGARRRPGRDRVQGRRAGAPGLVPQPEGRSARDGAAPRRHRSGAWRARPSATSASASTRRWARASRTSWPTRRARQGARSR